jgi:hypothetical protein
MLAGVWGARSECGVEEVRMEASGSTCATRPLSSRWLRQVTIRPSVKAGAELRCRLTWPLPNRGRGESGSGRDQRSLAVGAAKAVGGQASSPAVGSAVCT